MRSLLLPPINKQKISDATFFVLLTLLYVSFYLPMGSSVPTLALLVYYLVQTRLKLSFQLSGFVLYCVGFTAFCYLSYYWATDTYYVLLYSNHILKSVFGILIVYICMQKKPSVDVMLKAMMWGGYAVMFYMIAYYGISGLTSMLSEAERLTNDVMNANRFAMCLAYTGVIHIYYGLKDKWSVLHLLIIPATLLLAVSGSRKGLIVLVGGILLIVILIIWAKERSTNALLKILLGLVLILGCSIFVLSLPPFRLLKERILSFLLSLTNDTAADGSLRTRSNFIEIGFAIFKDHPILGVGIDNARLFNYRNVYLHNNFIEVLADGGLVGFLLYYSMYGYLLIRYFRADKHRQGNHIVCFVILLFTLMTHYAVVSYTSSTEYFILLMCFLQITHFDKGPEHT